MKDKRGFFTGKDKTNPCEGYLYKDEKILWMDGSLKTTRPNDRKTFAYLSLTALIIWIIVVGQFRDMSVVISTSGACIFFIALVYGLAFWTVPANPMQVPAKGVYALTNRHLFYWNGEQVTEIALENMPEILLLPGAGSQATLTFGNVIPSMRNIDDAAYVKTMIEQARKEHLKGDQL